MCTNTYDSDRPVARAGGWVEGPDKEVVVAHVVVTPLTSTIGARVTGVDLRRELPSAVADQIREAFWKHFILVFPNDTEVGLEEQNRLAGLFGVPQPLAMFQFLGALHPAISFDSTVKAAVDDATIAQPRREQSLVHARVPVIAPELRDVGLGGDFDGWHTDSSYTPWLPRVAVLRAEVISPVGGDTSWTSLCAAYDRLSPTMKSWLADAKAVHIVAPGVKEAMDLPQYGPDAEERFDAEYPPREWPVVIEHPENGRKGLFVNPAYTVHLVGMTRPESNAVLRLLFAHIASASFIYRHHWSPGDLVLWDELTTLHRAPDDFAPHERKVVRVTAGRVVPTAPAARGDRRPMSPSGTGHDVTADGSVP
jgi:alpha-ketoglutarate-dependent taurine dioxygenase